MILKFGTPQNSVVIILKVVLDCFTKEIMSENADTE